MNKKTAVIMSALALWGMASAYFVGANTAGNTTQGDGMIPRVYVNGKRLDAEVIMKNFDLKNVELRLFSPDIRSQLLMDSFSPKLMRAIRIDDIQTLVYHNLYTHGKMLFDRARTVEGEKDKVISAVIVGLGQYGKEMFKALALLALFVQNAQFFLQAVPIHIFL